MRKIVYDAAANSLRPTLFLRASSSSSSSSGVGGICSVLVGHPLDLIKVRLQTSSSSTNKKDKNNMKQSGTFATLWEIVKKEGPGGLYRGVAAPLVAVRKTRS